jgi:tRNA pseudouridine38-40 synthase
MPRVALAFAYDGGRFDSYARQPGRRTVESQLLTSLAAAGALEDGARVARFASGSRTDRGASAAFNVCALDTQVPPSAIVANAPTPAGMWLLSAVRAPDGFNPRHARSRRYRYFLPADGLEPARVRGALGAFLGEHDLAAFCRPEEGRPTRRRVDRVAVRPAHGFLEVTVTAPNFLWQQVRRMVSAAQGVAAGRWPLAEVRRALAHPVGARDFGAVSARGLVLEGVDYALALPRPARHVRTMMRSEVVGARAHLGVAEAVLKWATRPRHA